MVGQELELECLPSQHNYKTGRLKEGEEQAQAAVMPFFL